MPALAVAEALRERGAEVSFIGARRSSGTGVAARSGYEEDTIPVRGFVRRATPRNLIIGLQALAAVPRAVRVLRRRRADAVLTAGGYVAGPVAVAARLTRRRIVVMEADSHFGLANRLIAPLARRVTLAFPLRGRSGRRYLVTGRPVSQAVTRATRTSGRRAFGVPPDATLLVIVGGSQGARTLNRAAVDAFADDPPLWIIHVAGPTQIEGVRAELATRPASPRYRVEGFLDNLPEAIAAADLVVARSGGSVFELAAIGRPSILVPYPHATGDHQTKNARWLADAGAAVVLADHACTGPKLQSLVGALLSDRRRLAAMADAAREVGRPDAAARVAEAVMETALH
jgi:UDP-N-acetylglucosamine--N-acetylmuramyl-(pentapeptide) pyrophosphoryl-undecaprenol N-acetylglucosamine transferase